MRPLFMFNLFFPVFCASLLQADGTPSSASFYPQTGTFRRGLAQAQARKDHLTNLFLNRGCKMSEIQR